MNDLVDWADVMAVGIAASVREKIEPEEPPVAGVLDDMSWAPDVQFSVQKIAASLREAYDAGAHFATCHDGGL